MNQQNRVKSCLTLRPLVKRWLIAFFLLGLALVISLSCFASYFVWRAQAYDLNIIVADTEKSSLYDENNQLIGSITSNRHREVCYEDLPEHLVQAVLAREDDNFFHHRGVELLSFARSFLRNVGSMSYKQGGSTISMQLARNVYELRGKSIERKLLEIAITRRIENKYSKEVILSQYLNRIYFGENCYGIADAAAHYFSKEVKDLNVQECAVLIGLVCGPSIYNPVVNREQALRVRNETLQRMHELGYLDASQLESLLSSPIELRLDPDSDKVSSYPLMLLPEQMRAYESYLASNTGSIALVSSLNIEIQRMVEQQSETCLGFIEGVSEYSPSWLPFVSDDENRYSAIVKRWAKLKRPKGMPARLKDGLASSMQCIVLVVDARLNSKGSILAMTAGRSVREGKNRWNTSVQLGEAAVPFLYCAVLQEQEHRVPLVPNQILATGDRAGYEPILRFYKGIPGFCNFPDEQHAHDLYEGRFNATLMDLARAYYSLFYKGEYYDLNFIRSIYSQNRDLLFSQRMRKPEELIQREVARVASTLPPINAQENKSSYASFTLPDGGGQWSVVCNRRGVCTFVWLGFDECNQEMREDKQIQALSREFSLLLAKQIHQESRDILIEQGAKSK